MSNTAPIEPTEEQKQAAWDWMASPPPPADKTTADQLAEFLAEREAKLREGAKIGSDRWHQAAIAAQVERDTLRARVAELEAEASNLWARVALVCIERDNLEESEAQHLARIAELEASRDHPRTWAAVEAREAQHLADIKALRGALSEGYALALNARERVLKATAHYDDAK